MFPGPVPSLTAWSQDGVYVSDETDALRMTIQKHSLDWVQALRGIASLSVVVCHSRYFFQGTTDWMLADRWLSPGAAGVDLFFMLSGFIMVYSTTAARPGVNYVVEFFIKRFARIWPVYAVLTVAWATLAGRGLSYFLSPEKLLGIVKSLLFLPVDPEKILYFGMTLPVGWSLNFEIYFYLVFGACLFFGKWRWALLFGWMLITLILLPAVFGQLSFDVWRPFHFPFTYLDLVANPIIAEFLAGVLIGLAYFDDRLRFSNGTNAIILSSVSGIAALLFLLEYKGPMHGLTNWGWPIAMCLFTLAIGSKHINLPVPRWMVRIGEISFSLYLVHGFVHAVTRALLEKFPALSFLTTIFLILLTTAASIMLACVSHQLLEQRLSDSVRVSLLRFWHERSMRSPVKSSKG